jgi:hypothetical protein
LLLYVIGHDDKGVSVFTFHSPLTTLRDNLIVALQDADGKEVSYAGFVENFLI